MKLKVLKAIRMPDVQDIPVEVKSALFMAGLGGAVYIEGETAEVKEGEGALLLQAFPKHFEEFKQQ